MSSFIWGPQLICSHAASDHVHHRVTLTVRKKSSLHTRENIMLCQLVDNIITKWTIPPQKVAADITDNHSNMLAKF